MLQHDLREWGSTVLAENADLLLFVKELLSRGWHKLALEGHPQHVIPLRRGKGLEKHFQRPFSDSLLKSSGDCSSFPNVHLVYFFSVPAARQCRLLNLTFVATFAIASSDCLSQLHTFLARLPASFLAQGLGRPPCLATNLCTSGKRPCVNQLH